MNKALPSFLLLSICLVACNSEPTDSRLQAYPAAMAEVSCNFFDQNLNEETIRESETAIYNKYEIAGEKTEIQDFIEAIEGTEDFNTFSVNLRTELENTCADELAEAGLSAAEMTESILGQ